MSRAWSAAAWVFVLVACGTATQPDPPACAHATDCPIDTSCIDSACVPSTACTSSRMCPGLVCDLSTNVCAECTTASDCEASETCEGGVCVALVPRDAMSIPDAGTDALRDVGVDAHVVQDAGFDVGTDAYVEHDAGFDAYRDDAGTCTGVTWNAAVDFRLSPDQANPSMDRWGNADVWRYLESPSFVHDPATYTLLPAFEPTFFGTAGQLWYEPSPPGGLGPSYSLTLGVNRTGSQIVADGQDVWDDGTLSMHPGISGLIILGWRSPFTGDVQLTTSFSDQNVACGNGVAVYLDENGSELRSSNIDNGGAGSFEVDSVAVTRGDELYLIVDPRGDYSCDATQVSFSVVCL